MHIVVIAWVYVALMMAVAEATSPIGTVLGAVITFTLYGVLPVALVLYIMGAPGRRQKIRARETAERDLAIRRHSAQPDAGGEAAGDAAVAPVREKP